MIQELKNNPIIKEAEFQNKFLKMFSIALCTTIVLLLCAYFPIQHFCLKEVNEDINSQMKTLTIDAMQILDKRTPDAKMSEEFNITLANIQHEMKSARFVKDVSISIYDLSRKGIVSKSFEVPIIESESAIEWWKERTMSDDILPKLSLNNEMMEFVKEYQSKGVYIAEMYELNGVLVPTKLVVLDSSGNEMKNCETHVPIAYEHKLYKEPTKLFLRGNRISDPIYSLMSEYEFINELTGNETEIVDDTETENIEYETSNEELNAEDVSENLGTTNNNKTKLNYKKEFTEKMTINSENVTINNNDYQNQRQKRKRHL